MSSISLYVGLKRITSDGYAADPTLWHLAVLENPSLKLALPPGLITSATVTQPGDIGLVTINTVSSPSLLSQISPPVGSVDLLSVSSRAKGWVRSGTRLGDLTNATDERLALVGEMIQADLTGASTREDVLLTLNTVSGVKTWSDSETKDSLMVKVTMLGLGVTLSNTKTEILAALDASLPQDGL